MKKQNEPIIIDGEDTVLGRLGSFVAKRALEGNKVIIVNAEKIAISGSKYAILEDFNRKLQTRTLGALEKSPIHHRHPERYVRRTIRGMLPYRKSKGRDAYKRIKVYVGVPKEIEGKQSINLDASSSKLQGPCIRVEDLLGE